MGIQITQKESIGYVDKGIKEERGCHQCNTLIFSAQQMPDRKKGVVCNNGWRKVIHKPKRNSRQSARQWVTEFTIQTPLQPQFNGQTCAGEIHVEYFDGKPDESVYNGVKTVLKNHTTVRRYENKLGNVAVGLRLDLVSSSRT